MKTPHRTSDIFAYSTSLRTWPKEIDLPVSIVVNKPDWSMETTPEEVEHLFAVEEPYNEGPMVTVTMDNGASLVIVEIDPEGQIQPEGSLRGDWKKYHQGHEEKLFPIIEIARKILKNTITKSRNSSDSNITVTATTAVVKDLAVALAESEGHSPEEAKKPRIAKRFIHQALTVLRFLKATGDAQKSKK